MSQIGCQINIYSIPGEFVAPNYYSYLQNNIEIVKAFPAHERK